jgi:hypothetical protein
MDPAISDKDATEPLEDMDCFFEKGAPGIVAWMEPVFFIKGDLITFNG